MPVLSTSGSWANRPPDNIVSGDFTITVDNGNYPCGNTVQPIVLDDSLGMTAGRWVVIRVLRSAGQITEWAGANVTPPTYLTVAGVSRENVNYGGVTYDCVVVTLV
jgi:hypothetical protein